MSLNHEFYKDSYIQIKCQEIVYLSGFFYEQYSSMNFNFSNMNYQTTVTYFKHFTLKETEVGSL